MPPASLPLPLPAAALPLPLPLSPPPLSSIWIAPVSTVVLLPLPLPDLPLDLPFPRRGPAIAVVVASARATIRKDRDRCRMVRIRRGFITRAFLRPQGMYPGLLPGDTSAPPAIAGQLA